MIKRTDECYTCEVDSGNDSSSAFLLPYMLSHKFVRALSLSTAIMIVPNIPCFHSDEAFLCFVMHSFVLFLWAFIASVCSQFQDEPWSFDDTSFLPATWSLDDPSSLPESDFENESESSMFTSSHAGELAMDTNLLADNDISDGEAFSGLDSFNPEDDGISMDEFHPEDYGISMDDLTPSYIGLDLEADCGGMFRYRGKRRAKRGASCKAPPPTSTEKKPDNSGPLPPSPGGPSFFPGYGSYIMDKKTNILRIPGFVPRYTGENDVCLIYTEGYLPYGVCGTELFRSVETFWGIETYTITKAVLGMLFTLRAPEDESHSLFLIK